MAFYRAYLDGHAVRAAQWLRGSELIAARRKTSLGENFDYWRAFAAVRQAEGRGDQADRAWKRAMHLATQGPTLGCITTSASCLTRFEREIGYIAENAWASSSHTPARKFLILSMHGQHPRICRQALRGRAVRAERSWLYCHPLPTKSIAIPCTFEIPYRSISLEYRR